MPREASLSGELIVSAWFIFLRPLPPFSLSLFLPPPRRRSSATGLPSSSSTPWRGPRSSRRRSRTRRSPLLQPSSARREQLRPASVHPPRRPAAPLPRRSSLEARRRQHQAPRQRGAGRQGGAAVVCACSSRVHGRGGRRRRAACRGWLGLLLLRLCVHGWQRCGRISIQIGRNYSYGASRQQLDLFGRTGAEKREVGRAKGGAPRRSCRSCGPPSASTPTGRGGRGPLHALHGGGPVSSK